MKRRTLTIVLVVVLAIVLRESGVLDVHYYRSKRSVESTYFKPGVPAFDRTLNYSVVWTDERGRRERHTVWANDKEPSGPEIAIEFERYELEGVDFLPLVKSGTCDFEAVVRLPDREPGRVTGTIEQSILGICTVGKFRELLREAAQEAIVGHP